MRDANSAHPLPKVSPVDGLLTPEQCRQHAEDCDRLGMTALAAKWRDLAEQTDRILAAARVNGGGP